MLACLYIDLKLFVYSCERYMWKRTVYTIIYKVHNMWKLLCSMSNLYVVKTFQIVLNVLLLTRNKTP